MDPLAVRKRFSEQLVGQGIEIGPGHVPFPVMSDASVRYVDRWYPKENGALFPDLGDSPGFPEPDMISNLDADRLSQLADESQDFVIASHVIEHLANPLAMLADIHRVLKTDGLLILLVPDRSRTFDRDRLPTPLGHLIDDYRNDVREVEDAHVEEFLVSTGTVAADEVTADDIELHRRRSVHVHVWDLPEFTEVLEYAAAEMDIHWEVLDAMNPGEEGTHGDEFGWLLSRQPSKSGC